MTAASSVPEPVSNKGICIWKVLQDTLPNLQRLNFNFHTMSDSVSMLAVSSKPQCRSLLGFRLLSQLLFWISQRYLSQFRMQRNFQRPIRGKCGQPDGMVAQQ
jgi:hypothetical protein